MKAGWFVPPMEPACSEGGSSAQISGARWMLDWARTRIHHARHHHVRTHRPDRGGPRQIAGLRRFTCVTCRSLWVNVKIFPWIGLISGVRCHTP